MAGVPSEQLPLRADECRLLPVDDYNNYDNPAYYYHDAGCYDYNDPTGNHDGGNRDYYNNGCCDNDYNGGEFLR